MKKIFYDFAAEFDCVYLLNGAFVECPRVVEYPRMSPIYVTLLPLKALLLPYTVRMIDGKAVSNADLTQAYEVADGHYAVRFKERHNYVYTPAHTQTLQPPKSAVGAFYRAVKSGEFETARRMMTKDLSDSVDDESLAAFFAPYCDIVENRFSDLSGGFFLINKTTLVGEPFDIPLVGDRISDFSAL